MGQKVKMSSTMSCKKITRFLAPCPKYNFENCRNDLAACKSSGAVRPPCEAIICRPTSESPDLTSSPAPPPSGPTSPSPPPGSTWPSTSPASGWSPTTIGLTVLGIAAVIIFITLVIIFRRKIKNFISRRPSSGETPRPTDPEYVSVSFDQRQRNHSISEYVNPLANISASDGNYHDAIYEIYDPLK